MATICFTIVVLIFQLTAPALTGGEAIVPVSERVEENSSVASENSKNRWDRQKRSDDGGPLEAVVMHLAQDLSSVKAQLAAMKAQLEVSNAKGSTFVRWGRSQCPSGTMTVYSGFAGGSDFSDTGSGSNRLCLSPDPVFDGTSILRSYGTVSGAQYYVTGHLNTDVLCALCHTALSATFMVPGTNRCPANATLQYHGHLSTEQKGGSAQADYVCLDSQPQDHPGSSDDQRPSAFFEHAITACSGSLACPPYQDQKVVTCAVCSI